MRGRGENECGSKGCEDHGAASICDSPLERDDPLELELEELEVDERRLSTSLTSTKPENGSSLLALLSVSDRPEAR